MPELENHTPFVNFRYYSSDSKGQDFGVLIVKATYSFSPSGRLLLAEEQAPMVFTDLCHGAVNVTSLRHPSDLVPNKPRTDVIVNAVARAPEGKPAESWICGLRLESRDGASIVDKSLRVTGPRRWQPRWKRPLSESESQEWQKHRRWFGNWELSQPEPITQLQLHYEYAYGGFKPKGFRDDGQTVREFDRRNPIGRGMLDEEWTDHTIAHAAPQIEAVDDLIREPYKIYAPQSFGPIPPAWNPRLPLGGTYDDKWRRETWPNWAADYDFAFHNSAHPDLICPGYLKGDERFTLTNLLVDRQRALIELPGDTILLDLIKPDGGVDQREMALDTVFLDVASDKRRKRHVFLSWRYNFQPDVYQTIRIFLGHLTMTSNAHEQASRIPGTERTTA